MQYDLSTIERWFSKVDFDGPTVEGMTTGCWLWVGSRSTNGYGRFRGGERGADGRRKMVQVHRWAYETIVGEIPEGLVADHMCRVEHCVNPHHIELVTQAVNIQRRGINRNNTSGVRGVHFSKADGKWRVQVQPYIDGKQKKISGGYFDDLADAEDAVIDLRARVFGPDAEREARLEVDMARAARAAVAA